MKKIIFIIVWLFILTPHLHASDTLQKQTWAGKLNFQGVELTMVLNIFIFSPDSMTATLDSPDQGAKGIPVSRITITDDSLTFSVNNLIARYGGRFTAAKDTLTGLFVQAGYKIPLNLVSQQEEFRLQRPQEPKPPFPYKMEEVGVNNRQDTLELAGTLTLPEGPGPFPAIVLVTGSGAQNRDEEIFGHKPFLLLADRLTKLGFAVLRYDDRGTGKSTGTYGTATTFDFASDAVAAIGFLKGIKGVDTARIGILGHSEGALVAEIVAAQRKDIAFIVLLAGPALTGEEIIRLQSELIARANGVSEELIRANLEINKQVFSVVKKTSDNHNAAVKIRKILEDFEKKNSGEEQAKAAPQSQIDAQIRTVTSPWFRVFLTLDPMRYIERIGCPVLALFGGLDLQVPPAENMKAMETGLLFAGNDEYTIEYVPGVNHLFQTATTGSPSEYGVIEETISPVVLEMIGNWLKREW
jgi:pimeloyl-ACP methyl ester carboxylesterase